MSWQAVLNTATHVMANGFTYMDTRVYLNASLPSLWPTTSDDSYLSYIKSRGQIQI